MQINGNNRHITLTIMVILLLGITLLVQLASFNILAQGDSPETEAEPEPNNPQVTLTPEPDKEYERSMLGEKLFFNFDLTNEGDFPETYHIEVGVENGGKIELFDPSDKSITLSKGISESIPVEITLPDGSQDYFKFYMNVTAKSILPFQKFIHAIVAPHGIIITAKANPVLVISTSESQLGKVTPGDTIELNIRIRCYVRTAPEVYLEIDNYLLKKSRIFQEKNLTITIDNQGVKIERGEEHTFKLTIEFPENFEKRTNYTSFITVYANDYVYDAQSKQITFTVLLVNDPKETSQISILSNPIAIIGASTILLIGIIGAAIGSSEASKYWILSALFIPLYTKLHKNKILDHFTRGRVYEYIRNSPGVHYSEIKRELHLNNGSLAYHLHTLEREELIRSRTSGRFKLFFPTDVQIPKDMEPQVSSIRRQLLDIIRDQPGITQKELASKLPTKKPRTISYHVKNMSREGVVRLEKVGRETKCFITDEVIEIKQNGVIFKEVDEEDSTNQYSDGMIRQI
jgi:predicted transcriptional regulator